MIPGTSSPTAGANAAVFSAIAEPDADQLRLPVGSVAREILEQPWKFDFFQAVLVLQQLASQNDGSPAAPIGRFSVPSEEAMRFTVPDGLAFPKSTIQSVSWDFESRRPTVCVNFMGLTGPSGILPRSYTERLQQIDFGARHENRHALRDWLDTFNHRLLSLFFDAWSKYRYPVAIQRQSIVARGRQSRPALIRVALASIGGLDPQTAAVGLPPPRDREPAGSSSGASPPALDRDELLGLAGVLAQRPMNVSNLQSALQRYLGVPVRIRQFQGGWLGLEPESQSSLGIANTILGSDALVGERIWSRGQKIQIEVGPLSPDEFQRFLPPTESSGGGGYRRLVQWVRLSVGSSMEFDLRPLLRVESALELALTAGNNANRLGIDSWLGTPPDTAVADDAIFAGT